MQKDFQIRIECDLDGEEDVHNFSDFHEAQVRYEALINEYRKEGSRGYHLELIEVLDQEYVEAISEE